MEEDIIIQNLNKKIEKDKKRIRNLRIRDDIIGFIPICILVGTVTTVNLKYYNTFLINQFYPMSVLASIFIGGIPSIYLPTKKTRYKIENYQSEIQGALDELYEFALEEDKKIMIRKKKI